VQRIPRTAWRQRPSGADTARRSGRAARWTRRGRIPCSRSSPLCSSRSSDPSRPPRCPPFSFSFSLRLLCRTACCGLLHRFRFLQITLILKLNIHLFFKFWNRTWIFDSGKRNRENSYKIWTVKKRVRGNCQTTTLNFKTAP